MLERDKGWYEHRIHLGLEDNVPDLRVEVFIDETLPLTAVEVPQLLMDNEINPVVNLFIFQIRESSLVSISARFLAAQFLQNL